MVRFRLVESDDGKWLVQNSRDEVWGTAISGQLKDSHAFFPPAICVPAEFELDAAIKWVKTRIELREQVKP